MALRGSDRFVLENSSFHNALSMIWYLYHNTFFKYQGSSSLWVCLIGKHNRGFRWFSSPRGVRSMISRSFWRDSFLVHIMIIDIKTKYLFIRLTFFYMALNCTVCPNCTRPWSYMYVLYFSMIINPLKFWDIVVAFNIYILIVPKIPFSSFSYKHD